MSINPVSDIVLDVAQAADPSKSLAARERLLRLGAVDGASADFAGVMETSAPSRAELQSMVGRMSAGSARVTATPMDARAKAYKGVEEFVLQNLVENMLPKESGVFGAGTAGDVWRSMLAEQLAKQIGRTVNLGLDAGGREMRGAAHAGLSYNRTAGRES